MNELQTEKLIDAIDVRYVEGDGSDDRFPKEEGSSAVAAGRRLLWRSWFNAEVALLPSVKKTKP